MGSRIAERFDGLRRRRAGPASSPTSRPAIPICRASAEILKALDRAGADVIEVGVPFSDPLADGPVIQRATERALAAGSNLRESLALVERIRADAVGADRHLQLREPDAPDGRRRVCAPRGGGRRRRRARARSADRRSGRLSRDAGRGGARYDIPVESDDDRRADPAGGGARPGIPLRDFAAWRDRRARSGGRRAPRRWSGGFARTRRCRSRSASASRGPSTSPRSARTPTRRSSAARWSRSSPRRAGRRRSSDASKTTCGR